MTIFPPFPQVPPPKPTFGLTLIFNEIVTVFWGREPIFLNIPDFLNGSIEIMPGVPYPIYRLAITGVSIVAEPRFVPATSPSSLSNR